MKKKNKKGFTIVELIVVMAVIGVLVLLAIPKFMGYTKEAKLTQIKSDIRQLENASERYYMDTNEWPKLTEEHYTKEELESYAEEIKNRTGHIIELDQEGRYYPIDYNALEKYVQKPKDGGHYILQNPVGEIFYVDKLTALGEEKLIIDDDKDKEETLPEPEKPISEIEGMRGYKLPVGSTYATSSQNASASTCTGDKIGDGILYGVGTYCASWKSGSNESSIVITFPTSQTIKGMDVMTGGYISTGTGTLRIQNYINNTWVTVQEKTFTSTREAGGLVNIDFEEKVTFEKMRIYQKAHNGSWVGILEVTLVK